ncbi:MAG: LysE family translocator [Pseudomonadota bacterium]
MTTTILFALANFAFVSSITPGPNNMMLMASGANFGLRRTLPHMFGVGLGFTFMIVLVGFGLAGLFEVFPILHTILLIGSVTYLLFLAWKIATAAPKIDTAQTSGTPITFFQAAAFQWVNPKAWMMALGAITLYVPDDQRVLGVFAVALIFGMINIPCVTVWAWMGVQVRRLLNTPVRLRVFNWTMALLLIASLYPILAPDQDATDAAQALRLLGSD